MVIATDAPLSDRNLQRLAARAIMGLARTGSSASNGSGDYVLAFSTNEKVRRPVNAARLQTEELANEPMSGLFEAAVEATEEAIYNSMFMATTTTGNGRHDRGDSARQGESDTRQVWRRREIGRGSGSDGRRGTPSTSRTMARRTARQLESSADSRMGGKPNGADQAQRLRTADDGKRQPTRTRTAERRGQPNRADSRTARNPDERYVWYGTTALQSSSHRAGGSDECGIPVLPFAAPCSSPLHPTGRIALARAVRSAVGAARPFVPRLWRCSAVGAVRLLAPFAVRAVVSSPSAQILTLCDFAYTRMSSCATSDLRSTRSTSPRATRNRHESVGARRPAKGARSGGAGGRSRFATATRRRSTKPRARAFRRATRRPSR